MNKKKLILFACIVALQAGCLFEEPDLKCEANERVEAGSCVACPTGSLNEQGDDPTGRDTSCDPILCRADEHVVSNVCAACPTGEVNDAGDDASGDDTTCVSNLCGTNEHVDGGQCMMCPAGTTNDQGDDPTGRNTGCDSILCRANERVENNVCKGCPAGTTNQAGDDASGEDTMCDPGPCGTNEHVKDGECEMCPNGTTNDQGDDPTGRNTDCDPILCRANERVENNVCKGCPAGTTNQAGDDASGEDTMCDDPTLCEANEYVVNNQCVGCPMGKVNDAGDDPSGIDTECEPAPCERGLEMCSTSCVDTQTDANHCGACGEVCGDGETCSSGGCVCAAGKTFDGVKCGDDPFSAVVQVPAGNFMMGSMTGAPDEAPVHEVSIPEFYIDTYEVTVARYKRCVDAGGCDVPKYANNENASYNYGAMGREMHPINGVTWDQAKTLCEWEGKRLPTEAEWEKAARGTSALEYPWGSETPTCDLAVMDNSSDNSGDGCGIGRTWEVGSKPSGASPYGAYDMAGNVIEWVADWYGSDYYTTSPEYAPQGPNHGSGRVLRGGSQVHPSDHMRAAKRNFIVPSHAGNSLGFRCAITID